MFPAETIRENGVFLTLHPVVSDEGFFFWPQWPALDP
jgi:hypothetical protein